jgi:hypothetical protein
MSTVLEMRAKCRSATRLKMYLLHAISSSDPEDGGDISLRQRGGLVSVMF